MGMFETLGHLLDGIAKNDVARGMILQAANDIIITKNDREMGYTEIKFANEGDDLQILTEDFENPHGGFRVVNLDNHDQIETVNLSDLDDGMS